MERYKKGGKWFLKPNVQTITANVAEEIYGFAKECRISPVIDMSGVENCVNDFLFMFADIAPVLVNTSSEILSVIYMTGYDKYIRIFEDFVSFEDDRRQLLNRRFRLV